MNRSAVLENVVHPGTLCQRESSWFRRGISLLLQLSVMIAIAGAAGCGGGGGGGGGSVTPAVQPYIVAAVIAFPPNHAPPGAISGSSAAVGEVQILDRQGGSAISNATVTINGVALSYSSTEQQYAAPLVVAPGDAVSVSVKVNSATYTASGNMFSAYPTIVAPAADSTWSTAVENLISWTGAAPSSTAQYAVGLFNDAGNLVWPASGGFKLVDVAQSNSSVAAGELTTTGQRYAIVGVVDVLTLTGAASGSGFLIGGFNFSPVTVQSTPVSTLNDLAIAPATLTLAPLKSVQLALTGSYSGGTQQDLTTTAAWSSSDSTKVTVNSSGLVTGVAAGNATITAQLDGVTATLSVLVFQPTASPSPPLSQSVTFQIDYAHSGRSTVGTNGPAFPPSATWSRTLNGALSYPIIVGNRVFVTTGTNASNPAEYGTSLYALDLNTGTIVWGPLTLTGTYSFSATAYDQGKLFVINFDGVLRAIDPATGNTLWTSSPPYFNGTSVPTAVNGIVYVGGLTAFDASNGHVLWTASTGTGKNSPTVSDDGVFISVPCNVYKFDPIVGTALWHYQTGCEGGGGVTAAYSNGKLYTRDYASSPRNQIFDAATGNQLGTFDADRMPSFSAQAGFFLRTDIQTNLTTLTAVDQTSSDTLWTFQGDGNLSLPPVIVDDTVVTASSSGTVYALSASSGNVLWTGNAGTSIVGSDEQNANQLAGLGVGEGWLVVPAGSTLVAWKLVP